MKHKFTALCALAIISAASLAGCAFVAVASRVGGRSQKSEVRKIVLDTSAKRNYNRALVVEFALKQLVGFER